MRSDSWNWRLLVSGRENFGDAIVVFIYLKGCYEEERLDLCWKVFGGRNKGDG